MNSKDLIRHLADGCFHSGESLGEVLGVSRTAVWKHIQKLEAFGLKVESVKGRGYRLLGGLDLLDADSINHFLSSSVLADSSLEILQSVDSTNSHVMSKSSALVSNVCLAEQQTAGRGRRGRTWVSPYGKNIYLSCSWVFDGGAAVLEGLSLAVGVALVRALTELKLPGVRLKWPNDLLWRGRKVAGVLLEMTGDASGCCKVVVGIGLNVSMAEEDSGAIDQPWVSLAEIALAEGIVLPSRNEISAKVLNQLIPLLREYSESGFSVWRQEWNALDAYQGLNVCLVAGSREDCGIARGVDESGALLLSSDSGLKKFSGGEVSLRIAPRASHDI